MKYSHEIFIDSLNETSSLAGFISNIITLPFVMTIDGMLGAGKTTFIKKIVSNWDCPDDIVNSPSFNLIHEYPVKDKKIFHLDLFRLNQSEQLQDIGLDDILELRNSVLFIEWAYRVHCYQHFEPFAGVFIKILEDDKRIFHFFSEHDEYLLFFQKLKKAYPERR